jgi:hypothetical protein
MKTKYLVLLTLFLSTVSIAGDSEDFQCPTFNRDPLGYLTCQVVGTTLIPFALTTSVAVSVAGSSGTSAAAARKEALLKEAVPFAANYLISPESEEGNPVLQAAFQIVADDPNALVVASPELAQRILDSTTVSQE